MSTIPVGSLTDRISITKPDGTSLGTMWARVRSTSVKGYGFNVIIRYRTDVEPDDRIEHRGRPLVVHRAEDLDGRCTWLFVEAAEVRP